MIKVGIEGADTPLAGEIIRILVNHPDVELHALSAPALAGRKVSLHHYGLIGEFEGVFSPRACGTGLDVLIVCGAALSPEALSGIKESDRELRIIDTTCSSCSDSDFIFGLSEIYRKPLVRGARYSFVPHPEEVAALIALYPLAARLLLSGDIKIYLEADQAIVPDSRLESSAESVAARLREAQLSFEGKVSFIRRPAAGGVRALVADITLPIPITEDDAHEAFESIYDDHNFTFHPKEPVAPREVAGTHKCLIGISSSTPGSLRITATLDPLMRGGASEAVHLLNLLFGLHERTGLALKASTPYLPTDSPA